MDVCVDEHTNATVGGGGYVDRDSGCGGVCESVARVGSRGRVRERDGDVGSTGSDADAGRCVVVCVGVCNTTTHNSSSSSSSSHVIIDAHLLLDIVDGR